MKNITFIDAEVSQESKRIHDFGAVKSTGEILHERDLQKFIMFMEGTQYICGHNIINHDIKYIREAIGSNHDLSNKDIIDTLYLSALLFPKRPYHALVKDDKLQTDELNNPFNDAVKAKDLFHDEVEAFNALPDPIERVEAMRRVESGEAYILYISPESLRSKTIERLLLGRKIVRFVIDEAPMSL